LPLHPPLRPLGIFLRLIIVSDSESMDQQAWSCRCHCSNYFCSILRHCCGWHNLDTPASFLRASTRTYQWCACLGFSWTRLFAGPAAHGAATQVGRCFSTAAYGYKFSPVTGQTSPTQQPSQSPDRSPSRPSSLGLNKPTLHMFFTLRPAQFGLIESLESRLVPHS